MEKELLAQNWILDPMDGFLHHVGGLWVRKAGGQDEFGFLARDIHANRNGVVHGGMLMTFIDRAFGQVARLRAEAPRGATVNLSVNFAAPMQLHQFARLTPKVTHLTGRMAFMEGTVFCDDTVIASAQGVWRLARKT
jgi:acyl-coenzyme A thioesterase PaaI-like protein